MAFPVEFKYANEDDFIQRLLIPLLQRVGFSLVVNYHGTNEHGKDLVFAEVDRLGHVRYHGLQAKYEASISLNESDELVKDARQAFATPFRHPQTGTTEEISSFYAVNGGSLGAEAINYYFNALRPQFHGNVHLLQGKDLVTLDRWASVNQSNLVGAQLSGLLMEVRYNTVMLRIILRTMSGEVTPVEKLKLSSVEAFLSLPLPMQVDTASVISYWHECHTINNAIDRLGGICKNGNEVRQHIREVSAPRVQVFAETIEASLIKSLGMLGPLISI